jgi:hypothetical protein
MYINGAAGGNRTLVIITEAKMALFGTFLKILQRGAYFGKVEK